MMRTPAKKLRLALMLSVFATALAAADYHDWAKTPPMGWNSWDCFGTTVTEEQTKAQADYMAAHLKAHGWQYIVVDIQWYEPGAQGHDYKPGAALTMDDHGRLLPAPNRFPSSVDGSGFTSLAKYVHGLGLKFGVHLMRGIPRQAVEKNLPVLGTHVHAQDIADQNSTCPWNPDMYGVDMTRPGAQAYYDSVFALFASWGVDYVKVDDIARPYVDHVAEIEGIRNAIDRTGRPIVLSLSPGATTLDAAEHVREHANLWRVSDDFWDRWLSLREQFPRLARWSAFRRPGAWPDADMLPFGVLNLGKRTTRFTPDEQRTVMTLWSIARSPLMHGGDMTKTDDFTLSLLTNDEVLAVNQHSENNRLLFERDDLVAWVADVPGQAGAKYLAVFNTRDRVRQDTAHASYVSEPMQSGGKNDAAIDIDVTGGSELFLGMDSGIAKNPAERVLWRDPVLHFADGTSRPLTAGSWKSADALWDSAQVRKDDAGNTVGIAAMAPARVSYAIPEGAVRFTATAVVEHWLDNEPAQVRFVATVARSANTATGDGVAVPVRLADLGFDGPVAVRDLWTHAELGTVEGEFSPVVPFHGAGLYRLTRTR